MHLCDDKRMFNPRPRIEVVPIDATHACYVIDDALLHPERLVGYAQEHRARFGLAPHNAYPGLELRMPEGFSAQLDDFFRMHVRTALGARRTQRMYSRLSMVTLLPHTLQPRQSICHRDRLTLAPNLCIAASVLYLFKDAALGGTSFFAPTRPAHEIERLMRDSATLDSVEFARAYSILPGYMTDSNEFFKKVLTVPARWNRLIFYDGNVFHTGDIANPAKLSADPQTGRLTLNGFFTCSKCAV